MKSYPQGAFAPVAKPISKSAPAQKFLVVSSFPRKSIYTGTREQLIALGIACPDQFPEGRKRLKWDYSTGDRGVEGWEVKKLKGGYFEFKKCYEEEYTRPEALTRFNISEVGPGHHYWEIKVAHDVLEDAQLDDEIRVGMTYLVNATKAARFRFKKRISRLRLVKPVSFSAAPVLASGEVQHG